VQRAKHQSPRISTDAGMQTERSDEQSENALSSILTALQPWSKTIDDSDVQPVKQQLHRISTDAGIIID
jgi:hypothetical protein